MPVQPDFLTDAFLLSYNFEQTMAASVILLQPRVSEHHIVCPSVSLHYPSSLSIIGRIKNLISRFLCLVRTLAPPDAMTPMPIRATSFTEIRAEGLAFFKSTDQRLTEQAGLLTSGGISRNLEKSRCPKVSFPKVSNGFQKMSKGFQMFPKVPNVSKGFQRFPNVSKGFQRFPRNCCTIA